VKSSLAPGSKAVTLYLEEAGLMDDLEKLGFGVVAYACTSCNGMSGALDPVIQQEIIDRDLYATAVLSGNRNLTDVSIRMQNRHSSHRHRWWLRMRLPVRSVLILKKMC
jgi:aconitase A